MIFNRKLKKIMAKFYKKMAQFFKILLKLGNLGREKNVEFVDLEKC